MQLGLVGSPRRIARALEPAYSRGVGLSSTRDVQCHLAINQDQEDRDHERDSVRAPTLIMKLPEALVVLFCSKVIAVE